MENSILTKKRLQELQQKHWKKIGSTSQANALRSLLEFLEAETESDRIVKRFIARTKQKKRFELKKTEIYRENHVLSIPEDGRATEVFHDAFGTRHLVTY